MAKAQDTMESRLEDERKTAMEVGTFIYCFYWDAFEE